MTASREGARAIKRILDLETKLGRAPVIGREHRQLVKAIGMAATAYRMALDAEQATATHDPQPLAVAPRASARRSPRRTSRASKRS